MLHLCFKLNVTSSVAMMWLKHCANIVGGSVSNELLAAVHLTATGVGNINDF